MKSKFAAIFILFFTLLQAPVFASAQSINSADIEKFITTMEYLNTQEDITGIANIDLEDELDNGLDTLISPSGKLQIYTPALTSIRKKPKYYGILQTGVRRGGFASVEQWARTGDAILLVLIASEMDPSDYDDMDEFTPEMMAMMPPEIKDMMASLMRMMDAMESVSAVDIATFMPYRERVTNAMDGGH